MTTSKDGSERKAAITRPVPAVSRAVAILKHLASSNEPVGLVGLARAVDVIPSTCLHILRVLGNDGFISMNANTRQYSIGVQLLSLAEAYCRQSRFVRAARRRLSKLTDSQGCALAAIEQQGSYCVVVAIGDTQYGLSLRVSVGTRFPALVSAHGLCMAAFGSEPANELRSSFAALTWERAPTFAQWTQEIKQARLNGFAVDDGHYIRGVKVLAVPIFSARDELLGSISAVGLSEQVRDERLAATTATIRELAQEIMREMRSDPLTSHSF